jgi:hypothetical protein
MTTYKLFDTPHVALAPDLERLAEQPAENNHDH